MLEMFKDEHGKTSSTRIILSVFFVLFVLGVLNGITIETPYLETIGTAILLCLGSVAARGTINNIGGRYK